MIEVSPDLPHAMRRVQSLLVDIIRTCVRELRQTSLSVDVSLQKIYQILHVLFAVENLLIFAVVVEYPGRRKYTAICWSSAFFIRNTAERTTVLYH